MPPDFEMSGSLDEISPTANNVIAPKIEGRKLRDPADASVDAGSEAPRPKVAGVILAAGASRRLGRPKQLLEFRGKPLVQHAIDHARASKLDQIVLVLGSSRDRIGAAVDGSGLRIVENPNFTAGQSTSLIAGLNAIDADVDGVLFLLGDQPGVTPEIIDAELAGFDGDPSAIVMTSWRGKPSHPVLIGRGHFEALRGLTGDAGARPIVAGARDRVRLVPADHPVPRDVDTEDDYKQLLADDIE